MAHDPSHDQVSEATDQNDAHVISHLSVEQKVKMLSGLDSWLLEPLHTSASEGDVHLGPTRVSDGPHGLRVLSTGSMAATPNQTNPATCFPPAVTLGSTWDPSIVERVGRALGTECVDQGIGVLLGPGLNIKRHPCGGRNFEYFSEDPLLSGVLAAAMVDGIQSQGVGACVKHFAANNHESHRNVVNAVVDMRTLREIYLRGFEIVVERASPWTVMCSYNLLNEQHCCEDHFLLTEVLRDEWGFDGLVMSDWGATNDRAKGIAAGLDVQMPGCGGAFDGEVLAAIANGTLDVAAVDRSVQRLAQLHRRASREQLTVQQGCTSTLANASDVHTEHHALAREAAAAGTVLLTNDGLLPLATSTKVALLGAFADAPRYQGAGSSQVRPTELTRTKDALVELLGSENVQFARVYNASNGTATSASIDHACRLAAGAQVAIVMAGLPAAYESEGFDRPNIDMPADMLRLIEEVCRVQPRTVVVLSNGAPIDMSWADSAAAVVEAYLGGQAGGGAIADVLMGLAEPGGRLAESFPVALSDLPSDLNFPGLPRQTEYRENLFVGYRFHESSGVAAKFPFGHGLSYGEFEWGTAALRSVDGTGQAPTVEVAVTNTGVRSGSQVVQVYLEAMSSDVVRPSRELVGFAKVTVGPGTTVTAVAELDDRALQYFDVEAGAWRTEAGRYALAIGRSSADIDQRIHVTVDATGAIAAVDPTSESSATTGAPRVDTGEHDEPWHPDDRAFEHLLGRPIPSPKPVRPFSRDSTIGELCTTPVGPLVRKIATPFIAKELKKFFPEAGPEFTKKFGEIVYEIPMRGVVATSEGKLGLPLVDALVDSANMSWSSVLKRAVHAGRARARPGRST